MKLEVGQKVLLATFSYGHGGRKTSTCDAEVTKVGRKWFHLNVGLERFNVGTGIEDSPWFGCKRVYLSEAHFHEEEDADFAWRALMDKFSRLGRPNTTSARNIVEAARLLGIELVLPQRREAGNEASGS